MFDKAEVRERFAGCVASLLKHDGRWLSLIGRPEGPERDWGPPRRAARERFPPRPRLGVTRLSCRAAGPTVACIAPLRPHLDVRTQAVDVSPKKLIHATNN